MKRLTKEQLEFVKIKAALINGIYKASERRLSTDNEISAGDLRRYNGCLEKIRENTDDNEFINFSVSTMTAGILKTC